MEPVELLGKAAGDYAVTPGVALGTLTGAGTYELLLTAAAGSEPDMSVVDSLGASVTAYVLTAAFE
jgi:hypothetical protein